MTPVEVTQGTSPIVLGLPHTGTFVPHGVMASLNPIGRTLADTDWHIHQLYDGVLAGASAVRATFHRYVIDANRDPSGASLYPGQNTTGLVPLTDFEGRDIWNTPPDAAEIQARLLAFHTPYHTALRAELERVRAIHGVAIFYDCHSIRSQIPFLFDGTLPDFNIGSNMGTTCDPALVKATQDICAAAQGYTAVTNGRFRGGWSTRHYGASGLGFQAIQMELAQSTYLAAEAAPWTYDTTKAAKTQQHLADILTTLAEMAPILGGKP